MQFRASARATGRRVLKAGERTLMSLIALQLEKWEGDGVYGAGLVHATLATPATPKVSTETAGSELATSGAFQ